ncbi:hypothetical protein [Candidatus Poriferisodalis sp.]|uniref:hypothetical protein n=1 Tax=Candidatus Poriferisodalis sp. TaxID=3101277 RepID=UPI003B5B4EA9
MADRVLIRADVDAARPLLGQLAGRCVHPLTADASAECMARWLLRDAPAAADPIPGCWALTAAYGIAAALAARHPAAAGTLAAVGPLDRALVR